MTLMSFAEQVFGWIVGYGDALPGRARRIVGLMLLLLMMVAPRVYTRLAVDYAEARAHALMTELVRSLPPTARPAPPTSHP